MMRLTNRSIINKRCMVGTALLLDGVTTGPDSFSGKIGKVIGGVVSNWDVKDFQPIPCESFPMHNDEALCDVINNQYYAYQICWSIIHGTLDPDLQLPEAGPLCHSRWLTLCCRILR